MQFPMGDKSTLLVKKQDSCDISADLVQSAQKRMYAGTAYLPRPSVSLGI